MKRTRTLLFVAALVSMLLICAVAVFAAEGDVLMELQSGDATITFIDDGTTFHVESTNYEGYYYGDSGLVDFHSVTVKITGEGKTGNMEGTPYTERWTYLLNQKMDAPLWTSSDNSGYGLWQIRHVVVGSGITYLGTNFLSGDSGNDLHRLVDVTFEERNGNELEIASGCFESVARDKTDKFTVYDLNNKSKSGKKINRFSTEFVSIALPEGTTKIGNRAFQKNGYLTKVSLPSTLKSIGLYAFYDTGITAIDLSHVEVMHGAAFKDSKLESITLYPTTTYTCEDYGCFEGCSKATEIIILDGVTALPDKMLRQTKSVVSLNIPASVTKIGKSVFDECESLMELTVDPANPVLVVEGNCLYSVNKDAGTAKLLYINPYVSEEIVVPAFVKLGGDETEYAVTEMDADATSGLRDNENAAVRILDMGASKIKKLGSETLYKAPLTSLVLPGALETIGAQAFSGLTIEQITIPASVKSIGSKAFFECANLATISFAENSALASVDSDAFNFGETTALAAINNLPYLTAINGVNMLPKTAADFTVSFAGTTAQWYQMLFEIYVFEKDILKVAPTYAALSAADAVCSDGKASDYQDAGTELSDCYIIVGKKTLGDAVAYVPVTEGEKVTDVDHVPSTPVLIHKGISAEAPDKVYYLCKYCEGKCTIDGSGYYPDLKNENGEKTGTYVKDDEVIYEAVSLRDHTFEYTINDDATCEAGSGTKTGICTLCGTKTTVPNPDSQPKHVPGDRVKAVEPTCYVEGYSGDILCVNCGTVLEKGTVLPVVEPKEYKMLDGEKAVWTMGSNTMLKFRSEAPFNTFMKVLVDGQELPTEKYMLAEGSIRVTLRRGYMNSLSEGTHTLVIVSTLGNATTQFTVQAAATEPETTEAPVTTQPAVNPGPAGDALAIAVALGILALGTAVIVKKVR